MKEVEFGRSYQDQLVIGKTGQRVVVDVGYNGIVRERAQDLAGYVVIPGRAAVKGSPVLEDLDAI
jgi:hypothetical protein